MERVSVARMATAKLQGGIHAARGMAVSGSVFTEQKTQKIINSGRPQIFLVHEKQKPLT